MRAPPHRTPAKENYKVVLDFWPCVVVRKVRSVGN